MWTKAPSVHMKKILIIKTKAQSVVCHGYGVLDKGGGWGERQ